MSAADAIHSAVVSDVPIPLRCVEEPPCTACKLLRVTVVACVCLRAAMIQSPALGANEE